MRAADLDPDLAALTEAVSQSPIPAFVLAVPSERVLAVSPSAHQLLDPTRGPVVGRALEEFMTDLPSGGIPLLMRGRIDGYETTRDLRADSGPRPTRVLIQKVGTAAPTYVLGFFAGSNSEQQPATQLGAVATGVVIGATTPHLIIDRISTEVEELLGATAEDVLGRSLLTLVTPASVGDLLWGLHQATTTPLGVPLQLTLLHADGTPIWAQLLLHALKPAATFAFTILPATTGETSGLSVPAVHALLAQVAGGVDAVEISRRLARPTAGPTAAALSRLSARELDIVTRLVSGDRVPAIAKALYLATSTVRNNLSSAFAKLGVSSQQQLIDLVRNADEPSG